MVSSMPYSGGWGSTGILGSASASGFPRAGSRAGVREDMQQLLLGDGHFLLPPGSGFLTFNG